MKQKVYTTTQARQNFFELIRLVEAGEEPIIIKKDSKIIIKLSRVKEIENEVEKKLSILNELGKIRMKTCEPEELKKIINTAHDISL